MPFLDLLRVIASHVIVLHHLAFYGPLSDSAHLFAPRLIEGLYDYGRLSVQVFFVVGGFLTGRSLLRSPPLTLRIVGTSLLGRYRRTGLPYLAALLCAIVANEIARCLMTHESISAFPSMGQLLAHALFIQDLLGYQALTAGIWYLAIDIQLVTLVLLSWWLSTRVSGSQKGPKLARLLLAALGILSLFYFNRNPALDKTAVYFMGSYFLGLLVAWLQGCVVSRVHFWLYSALVLLALTLDFRSRLLCAQAVAVLLLAATRFRWLAAWPNLRVFEKLGKVSYSLFLIHFPVCLLVNAAWSHYLPPRPGLALLGMAVAYGLSVGMAFVFHRGVERPLSAFRVVAPNREVGRTAVGV